MLWYLKSKVPFKHFYGKIACRLHEVFTTSKHCFGGTIINQFDYVKYFVSYMFMSKIIILCTLLEK